ncbi:hypothetical protein B0T10DRAFT_558943 [Thelonectria olida]|uniref:Uncharacterized protein n=1 Tax=Thelonectria olida TaxID=1576542 RepID=A0A9P8WB44_9HYPO|nr:hypothetical protein B0T10DRAFT_558943 [Thelonectria olida]
MADKVDPNIPTGSLNKDPMNPGTKPRAMDAEGAIGKQFTSTGAIGAMGEAVGGPLASDGMIGKHFNADGAVGGTIQNMAGGEKKK